jgi:hypothetical protein
VADEAASRVGNQVLDEGIGSSRSIAVAHTRVPRQEVFDEERASKIGNSHLSFVYKFFCHNLEPAQPPFFVIP